MIIAFPHRPGSGGPGSFQLRIEKALSEAGWVISYPEDKLAPDVVMVVGGTKRLWWLWKMKIKGIPILYRLDGIGWLHRKRKIPLKKYVLEEYRNQNNKFIHAFLADHIVYQSHFVKEWWTRSGWRNRSETSIIYNGVDIEEFYPKNLFSTPLSLVCLEGTIDYSPYAVNLLNQLRINLPHDLKIKLYGRFEESGLQKSLHPDIIYKGPVPRSEVPQALQHAIYLSMDIHPACPNGVIEAMACGAPVVAFETGSIQELVFMGAGEIVKYGSDPWKLEYPDVDGLTQAILKVKENWEGYSFQAQLEAQKRFCIKQVLSSYLTIIGNLVSKKNEQ